MDFHVYHEGHQVRFVDGRFYTKDDINFYPGITTILSAASKGPQYDKWLKANGFNADRLAKEAMDQGSRVHDAIEQFCKGEHVKIDAGYTKNEWEMFCKFIDFFSWKLPTIIGIESIVVSDRLKMGSQIDMICEIDGQIWLIDHKTGGLYDTHRLQLGCYYFMLKEWRPDIKIDKIGILHLDGATRGRDKQGKKIQGHGWRLEDYGGPEEAEAYFDVFMALKIVWDFLNPDFKPMTHIYPSEFHISMFNKN